MVKWYTQPLVIAQLDRALAHEGVDAGSSPANRVRSMMYMMYVQTQKQYNIPLNSEQEIVR
jgi:hypothetical protein